MVLTMILQMAARITADFLGQMTSVERVLEYSRLPAEDNMETGRENISCIYIHSQYVNFL